MNEWRHMVHLALLAGVWLGAAPVPGTAAGSAVHDQRMLLDLGLQRVRAAVRAGKTPVVIFDLDDTLFRVANRTKQILIQFARDRRRDEPELLKQVRALSLDEMHYSLGDNLTLLRIHDESAREEIDAYWADRFFSNDWFEHDSVIPGALAYVRAMEDAGARIAYLTGRDEPRMGAGSRRMLVESGFPLDGEGSRLFLKPQWETPDVEYKAEALAAIGAMGPIVATFDNEPKNANLFRRELPLALNVLVGRMHSPSPVTRAPGVLTVDDFRR